MEKIKVLEEGKIYKFSYDIHVNSELDSKISKQIKLLGESIRLLTNNPARWEIAILYENIPLSWKRQDFKNNELIKETPCINSASTEEIVEIYPDIINFKLAQEIVKYRKNVAPIQNIEDLKRIPGINDQQIHWIADFSRAIS
ncbi:MAG: helix-hairpin-helix domain-containing protein [Actinobacteria bacterium]|nr:helix-hairpin-helix domain-containing protein [Actinomycetota bacterium]